MLAHLDTAELRSFALANKSCNNVASIRLWHTLRIYSPTAFNPQDVSERFAAVLRDPIRARHVRKLVIGAGNWAWDRVLLEQLDCLWQAVPHIQVLLLEDLPKQSQILRVSQGFTCDLAPVIRSLAAHGGHLRLQTFKYNGWLTEGSHLHQFLLGQPHLTELIGVDMYASRPVESSTLLPSLRRLVCDEPAIATSLLANHAIELLQIRETQSCRDIMDLCSVFAARIRPLEALVLSINPKDNGSEILRAVVESIPNVRSLVLKGAVVDEEHMAILSRRLRSLTDLECEFSDGGNWRQWEIRQCLSMFGPSLVKVVGWEHPNRERKACAWVYDPKSRYVCGPSWPLFRASEARLLTELMCVSRSSEKWHPAGLKVHWRPSHGK